jgi:hypothetical protein
MPEEMRRDLAERPMVITSSRADSDHASTSRR